MKKYCKRFGLWTLSFLLLLSLMSIGNVPVTAEPDGEQSVTISYSLNGFDDDENLTVHALTDEEQVVFLFTPVDGSDEDPSYTVNFAAGTPTEVERDMVPGRYSVTQTVTPDDFLPIQYSDCIVEISAEKNQVELQNVKPFLKVEGNSEESITPNSYHVDGTLLLAPAIHNLSANQIGYAFPTGSLRASVDKDMAIIDFSGTNNTGDLQPPTTIPFEYNISSEMQDENGFKLWIKMDLACRQGTNPPTLSTFTLKLLDAQNNVLADDSCELTSSTTSRELGRLFIEKTINMRPLQGKEIATFKLYRGEPLTIWDGQYGYYGPNENNLIGTYKITANDLEPEDGSWPGAEVDVRRTMIEITDLLPGIYHIVETTPGTASDFLSLVSDGKSYLVRELWPWQILDKLTGPITFELFNDETPRLDLQQKGAYYDETWRIQFDSYEDIDISVLSLNNEPLQMPQLSKEFRRSIPEDPLFSGNGTTKLDLSAEKDASDKEVDMRIQFNAPQFTEGEITTIEEFMYQQADWRCLTLTDRIPESMTLNPDSLKLVIERIKPGSLPELKDLDFPLILEPGEGSLSKLLLEDQVLDMYCDVVYSLNYDGGSKTIELEIKDLSDASCEGTRNDILSGLHFKLVGTCKLNNLEDAYNERTITNTVNMVYLARALRSSTGEEPLQNQFRARPWKYGSFAQDSSSASASVITAPPTPEPSEPTPSEPTEPTPPHCTEPVPPRTPWTPPVYYKFPEPAPTGAPVTVKAKPVTVNAVPIVNTLPKTGAAPVHTTFALSAMLCAFGIYLLTSRRG